MRLADALAVASLFQDPVILKALGKDRSPSMEGIQDSIRAIRALWGLLSEHPDLMFVIIFDDEVIGLCDMRLGVDGAGCLIGEPMIAITEKLRRKGYGASALRALAQWSFAEMPLLTALWGSCVETNEASIELMISLGMDDDGVVASNEGTPVRRMSISRPDH